MQYISKDNSSRVPLTIEFEEGPTEDEIVVVLTTRTRRPFTESIVPHVGRIAMSKREAFDLSIRLRTVA